MNNKETFDAAQELRRVRMYRAQARRRLYRKSRLERYRAELVAMKKIGTSCSDLSNVRLRTCM